MNESSFLKAFNVELNKQETGTRSHLFDIVFPNDSGWRTLPQILKKSIVLN